MPATIKIKNSSTASAVPTSSDLVQGELAVNVTDKRIFTENASGTVVELGTNPSILTLPDGSASAPTLTNDGDTNTGIFFPAADTVGITTGGTERARVDSSGNLGLGVTPKAWASTFKAIQVSANTALWSSTTSGSGPTYLSNNVYFDGARKYIGTGSATEYQQNAGSHLWLTAGSGSADGTITFTQAMTLDGSGNLAIGTTSANSKLNLQQSTDSTQGGIGIISVDGNGAVISRLNDGGLTFRNGGAERARIDSSGNLLVGTTTVGETTSVGVRARPDGVLRSTRSDTVNTASTLDVYSTGASAYRFYVGMAGTVYATSTTITAISDQRFKENIRDLDDGLDVVMALKPRKFDWKEGKGQNIKDARGFIAQEFEEVLPDMVEEWRDPAPEGEEPYKAVNANLIPTLVKAIQEQQAIITALTARITALEQA
jgi:hypothetical protein